MATATQSSFTPDFAANLRGLLVADIERESVTTAQVVSAIPEARRDYRPDPKARTAYELGWHLVASEVWFLHAIADLNFEKMYENEKKEAELRPASIAEIAAWYRKNLPPALDRLRKMTPHQLSTVVNFFGAFNLPAFQYIGFAKSHSIHHRGQLSAYLRPMGSKVPSIYGGSADTDFQL